MSIGALRKRSLSKAPLSSVDISKAFEPFDVNRDGLVTRKEFHRGLQSVAPSITAEDTKSYSRKRIRLPVEMEI